MKHPTLQTLIANDVVPTHREQYLELATSLELELRPHGTLELLCIVEILRSTWRLQRYAATDESTLTESNKSALDRCRARNNSAVRRAMAELRRLQTDRHLAAQHGLALPPLVRVGELLKKAPRTQSPPPPPPPATPSVAEIQAKLEAIVRKEEELHLAFFAKRPGSHTVPDASRQKIGAANTGLN